MLNIKVNLSLHHWIYFKQPMIYLKDWLTDYLSLFDLNQIYLIMINNLTISLHFSICHHYHSVVHKQVSLFYPQKLL